MKEDFTELELDTLQEIMNMAFGHAAADLAEVVDVFVQLNSPEIQVIAVDELAAHVEERIANFSESSVVEQQFRGGADGIALLVFPRGAEKELISFFKVSEHESMQSDIVLELEREVLMEIGNILIGACVGRLFELLQSSISYLPPRAVLGHAFPDLLSKSSFSDQDFAITMRTAFSFEDREVTGYLLLINRDDSAPALKQALSGFWSQYQ